MLMPDDSALLHSGRPYDPAAARAYYLRTRQLKGRKLGIVDTSSKESHSPKVVSITKNSFKPIGTSKRRQDEADARVVSIRARLDRLKDVLNTLVQEATPKTSTSTKKDTPSSGPDKKSDLTTKQKKEAAVRSKDFYDKNKKTTTTPDKPDIDEVRAKIKKIRVELKAAVERARNSKTASKAVATN